MNVLKKVIKASNPVIYVFLGCCLTTTGANELQKNPEFMVRPW